MDIDWSSEDVIESALMFFNEMNIPCLLFQTHDSKMIGKEKSRLFSHELHPNFCENSEHGQSTDDVFKTINPIYHIGQSIRAHKYYMPDDAIEKIITDGYKYTINHYTNLEYHQPFTIKQTITELNTFFEDGYYLKNEHPFDVSFVIDKMQKEGLYVFNLHPIHIAFNEAIYDVTRRLKDTMTREQYRNIDKDFINLNINTGYGIRTFMIDLIDEFRKLGYRFIGIDEVNQ